MINVTDYKNTVTVIHYATSKNILIRLQILLKNEIIKFRKDVSGKKKTFPNDIQISPEF